MKINLEETKETKMAETSSKLIMIRGNSGSGKTTTAKALQQKLGRNTMIISQDMVRREILWVNDGFDTPALPLLKEMLLYGHAHCPAVILEGIMKAEWYQPLFTLARETFGDQIYAYYFDLPFEETLRRHAMREKAKEFGEAAMRRWWNEKDFLPDISERILSADLSPDQVLSIICDDIFHNNMRI